MNTRSRTGTRNVVKSSDVSNEEIDWTKTVQ